MKVLDVAQIHKLLIEQGITKVSGKTLFEFLSIQVALEDKSPYGYIFQNWLEQWFKDNDIYFHKPHNSQSFPDFFMNPHSEKKGLLEVKIYDSDATPNFDIANFEAYCRSLKTDSYRLDADYLIFAYKLDKDKFYIKNLWHKKIWEICCPSKQYPIKLQVKQRMIYNIRPATWYSEKTKNKPFTNKEDFLAALADTLNMYKKTKIESKTWLTEVLKNYVNFMQSTNS